MTIVVSCNPLMSGPNSVKARQQAMLAPGDFARQAALEADLIAILRSLNRGGSAGLVEPGEHLEAVITK